MANEYLAPLITTLFFLSATLAGIYIYCCYFRTSKEENVAQTPSTNKAHRNHEEEKNIGILTPNFYNHIYPFSMALPSSDICGFVNVDFPSSPTNTASLVEEKNAKDIDCPFKGKELKEIFHDRPFLCRSTSREWVNSHCQLQVIQEVNEEGILDEESAKSNA